MASHRLTLSSTSFIGISYGLSPSMHQCQFICVSLLRLCILKSAGIAWNHSIHLPKYNLPQVQPTLKTIPYSCRYPNKMQLAIPVSTLEDTLEDTLWLENPATGCIKYRLTDVMLINVILYVLTWLCDPFSLQK